MPQITLNKLQRCQNTAARIVTRTSRFSHITPVLKDLHWLPIRARVEFKILTYAHKAIHDHKAPTYMSDMVNVYKPPRTLRSMDSLTLVVPCHKTVFYGNRQFKRMAAKLWNALPSHIREIKTLSSFKKELKTHMFLFYFDA